MQSIKLLTSLHNTTHHTTLASKRGRGDIFVCAQLYDKENIFKGRDHISDIGRTEIYAGLQIIIEIGARWWKILNIDQILFLFQKIIFFFSPNFYTFCSRKEAPAAPLLLYLSPDPVFLIAGHDSISLLSPMTRDRNLRCVCRDDNKAIEDNSPV